MQKMASKPAWELSSDYRVLLFNHWVMSNSLWSNGLQLARFLGPLVSPRVCSNSCPSSQWCYLTISSSAAPFSYCLQSFLQSRSFPMVQLFAPGGQSTGISTWRTFLPVNIQGWFSLGSTTNQNANICWITEKAREFQKHIYFYFYFID